MTTEDFQNANTNFLSLLSKLIKTSKNQARCLFEEIRQKYGTQMCNLRNEEKTLVPF